MVLKKIALLFLAITVLSLLVLSAYAQTPDGAYIEIKVYGDAGAKALMQFGVHTPNTRTLDSAVALGTWRENEPPPIGPGFDAVWGPLSGGQFGAGIRGLLGRDFRGTAGGAAQKDTFDIRFGQADNSAAPISFKWSNAAWIALRADSLKMFVFDPTNGNYTVNMMTQDSLNIPAAGDNGVARVRIFKFGIPLLPDSVVLAVKKENATVPGGFALNQNYPNPFNPSTKITFDIQKKSVTDVSIFNVLGQKIATLVTDDLTPGSYSTVWNGTTNNGTPVSSGVYYVRLTARADGSAAPFTAVRKLLLTK